MAVQLNLEIDVQKIIQGRETHWDFYFANDLAPDDLMRGFELKVEEIDFKGVDRFGDLNSFFGLNIEFNPHLWALVWGSGYNVQFNLYADTYDEKCVNVFASLGLVVLLCRCERNNRTLQAANLIMKARDKALLLLRTHPKILKQDESEVERNLAEYRKQAEARRLELEVQYNELSKEQDRKVSELRSACEKDILELSARTNAKREELQKAIEALEPARLRKEQELKGTLAYDVGRLEKDYFDKQCRLSRELSRLGTEGSLERDIFVYTKEQRKANKARASAIRLKARTMSFVDKRSIR